MMAAKMVSYPEEVIGEGHLGQPERARPPWFSCRSISTANFRVYNVVIRCLG